MSQLEAPELILPPDSWSITQKVSGLSSPPALPLVSPIMLNSEEWSPTRILPRSLIKLKNFKKIK